jgi:hypothetical protein
MESKNVVKYFDIDSTFRNRNNYNNPFDFVIPTSFGIKGDTSLSFQDPILDSTPFTGSTTLLPGQLVTQSSSDSSKIKLDIADVDISNFYINSILQIGNGSRTIVSYDGASRVATVNLPFVTTPVIGTQYFIRRLASYFSSNTAIAEYDPITNTVTKLNLLTTTPSLVRDFYSGTFIRYTNGSHIGKTALITNYEPNGDLLVWSQKTNDGANSFVSTVYEEGFSFTPNITGVLNRIIITLTSFEDTSPTRNFLLKVRNGIGLNGSVVTNQVFTVNNTSTPTDTTFDITGGSVLTLGSYYTISVIDTTPGGADTGYLNFIGISPSSLFSTYSTNISNPVFPVYPRLMIEVLANISVYSQPDKNKMLLDNVASNVSSSYSLRKLRSGYTGSAIRVRRSSDNQEQDIGFTDGGQIDFFTLRLFNGSTSSSFVTIWYDQSLNENNARQTTNEFQPRIIDSGRIDKSSDVIGIVFNGINNFLILDSYPLVGQATCSINLVCKLNNTNQNGSEYFSLGSSDSLYLSATPNNGTSGRFDINNGVAALEGTSFTQIQNKSPSVINFNHRGTQMNVFRNGSIIGSSSTPITIAPSDVSGGNNYIGKSQFTSNPYLSAIYQELSFFNSVLSSSDQKAVEFDQFVYYSGI